jgi:hypothetical protein
MLRDVQRCSGMCSDEFRDVQGCVQGCFRGVQWTDATVLVPNLAG